MEKTFELSAFVDSMKNALSLNSKKIVGIDIGCSSVKLAEVDVQSNGRVRLLKFVSVPLPEGSILDDEIIKAEEVVSAINEALSKTSNEKASVCFGMFGANAITKKIQVANGSREEIDDQVYWEIEQYVPFDLEESIISYDVIGENNSGGVDIVFCAVKSDHLDNFKALFEQTKTKVKIVDTNIAAITNVFEYNYFNAVKKSDNSFIILDFGAQRTEFVVYREGTINFCKEMNIGGTVITEEIQRKMGMKYSDAEDLKIVGDSSGNLPEDVLTIMDDVIEVFLVETKKTLDFYIQSTSDETIKQVYITGGSCQIPGFVEALERALELEVSVLNPLEKIEYDRKFSSEEIKYIGYCGVAAIGLAMRSGD